MERMPGQGVATFWGTELPERLQQSAEIRPVTMLSDIEPDAGVVVLHVGAACVGSPKVALGEVRQRCREAVIVAFAPTRSPVELDDMLELGYDQVVSAPHQLLRVVASVSRVRDFEIRIDKQFMQDSRVIDLMNEISDRPDLQSVLQTCVVRLSESFGLARVGVILFDEIKRVGYVVVPAGSKHIDNLVVRLDGDPSLTRLSETLEPGPASDELASLLLNPTEPESPATQRDSGDPDPAVGRPSSSNGLLFPMVRQQRALGALWLQHDSELASPGSRARLFDVGRLVASITSVSIGNALAEDELLETQRELLRKQRDVDQQLESLQTFSEIFERSFDGILVTDPQGYIRYANAAAGAVLQQRPEQLHGVWFLHLLNPRSHVVTQRAFNGDAVGDAYGYVDLLVPDAFGSDAVISASIRPIDEDGAVLISFRDVTELREIESELRQTKDFLENLIQSSVDAIVAADADGRIILFNRSAEQILGYRAREVVGKMNMAQLYPTGEVEDVQRRLRSEAYGGRGRLEQVRKDLISKSGEAVPCNLTAALIYEEQGDSATVCVFTDLRERLKIEAKLSQVQQRLRVSERQAVAMELAGTAAHELNQPLTSILGYAAILERQGGNDELGQKAVGVIAREVERMAAIVKKIGQLTAYEPKQYVGESRILDLGRKPPGDGSANA